MSCAIVNVRPFRNKDASVAERRACSARLVKAAAEFGFLYVVGHGLSNDLFSEAIDWTHRFFSLPLEVKKEIDITRSRSTRGYQALGVNVTKGRPDRHEGIDLYKDTEEPPEDFDGPTNMGRNQWLNEEEHPEMAGFRRFWEENYVPAMLQLGKDVMEAFAVGLELPENYFESFYNDSFWIMRLLHYPWVKSEELKPGELGCGVHTDYGCLTLLLADEVRGCLQAQNVNGDWVNVEPLRVEGERAFVVNLGDMLEKWTCGAVRATPHRVLPPLFPSATTSKSGRISIPFFFEPNYDAVIEPIRSTERQETPTRVVYGDHLLSKTTSNFSFQEGVLAGK